MTKEKRMKEERMKEERMKEERGKEGMKREEARREDVVDRVFVYGTLMEGFWNHVGVLEGKAVLMGKGEVPGCLYHLREGYPALVGGEDRVAGEVYGPVDRDLLRQLDYLEGYAEGDEGSLYERKPVEVRMSDGSKKTCWTYVYGDPAYARATGIYLPHGDWRRHMRREEA